MRAQKIGACRKFAWILQLVSRSIRSGLKYEQNQSKTKFNLPIGSF